MFRSHQYCNVYSALNYIQKRVLKSYWCETDQVQMLKSLFKTPTAVDTFALVLDPIYVHWVDTGEFPANTPESVKKLAGRCIIDTTKPIVLADLMKLKRLSRTQKDFQNGDQLKLFLTFLYYRGYFTCAPSSINKKRVKLVMPNQEISATLKKHMIDAFKSVSG